MAKIIECVPNFSEGRDKKVIEEIAEAIRNTQGVTLLDVDPGHSTNRTVYTFVGDACSVVDGAVNGARVAFKRIDMRKHKGSHPRIGSLDVCPFIPVANSSVAECIAVAKVFGSRLATELGVPVYLYGAASTSAHRQTLPQIRAGEYEGLRDKLKREEWEPDFGPSDFVEGWGATVTGVRKFLIAYNINLIATKEQAHRIALNLREQGRGEGQKGRLECCQAIGWYLQERDIAQISMNLTDFKVTPIHKAFEEAKKDACDLKLPIIGSEIVGLIPLTALLHAAEYYIERENLFVLEEDQKIMLAVERLGLNSLSPFNPRERIIEYCVGVGVGGGVWARRPIEDFIKGVAARTPTPGGGSVAAAVGAMGAGLGAMAGQLTYGKRQWENLDGKMRSIIPPLHNTALRLTKAIDADSDAFNAYMEASKLPQRTEEEREERRRELRQARRKAVSIPLSLMEAIDGVWSELRDIAHLANINCKSDVQVAARCLESASWGGYYNILINLNNDDDDDDDDDDDVMMKVKKLIENAQKGCKEVLEAVEKRK